MFQHITETTLRIFIQGSLCHTTRMSHTSTQDKVLYLFHPIVSCVGISHEDIACPFLQAVHDVRLTSATLVRGVDEED